MPDASSSSPVNLTAPSQVRELLRQFGVIPEKGLGQNFLIDGNILRKVVDAADLTEDDYVLEIGAGLGTLTQQLSLNSRRVVTIEVDDRLIPVLERTLIRCNNVRVIHGDALKIDLFSLLKEEREDAPWKVVANIPYGITGPLIAKLVQVPLFSIIVLMVQAEVAQRIVAIPSTREYGVLTLLVNYFTIPDILFKVPRSAFFPEPEVDSAVVRMVKRSKPAVNVSAESLLGLVRFAFRFRRKSLRKALTLALGNNYKEGIERVLEEAGIDGQRRGETLSLEEYGRLAKVMEDRMDFYKMKVIKDNY